MVMVSFDVQCKFKQLSMTMLGIREREPYVLIQLKTMITVKLLKAASG